MSSPTASIPLVPLLNDDAMDDLFDFLDSEHVDPEALTLFETHGLLVALAIAPTAIATQLWMAEIFNGTPHFDDEAQRDALLKHLETLYRTAGQTLEEGQLPELPFDLEIEKGSHPLDTPVSEWCTGFMTGVFMQEEVWFSEHEEQAAQLLLPFMALSGLFEEEDPELAAMANSPQHANTLAQQLPELTLDLYLLYRVPPEKPMPRSNSVANRQKKTRRRPS